MNAYGGVHVEIHVFLTSALVGGEQSASRPCCFTHGERASGIHCTRSWLDPGAVLDDEKKRKILPLLGLELRPLGRLARSRSVGNARNLYNFKLFLSLFSLTMSFLLFYIFLETEICCHFHHGFIVNI
jgi:hypothetical protein